MKHKDPTLHINFVSDYTELEKRYELVEIE